MATVSSAAIKHERAHRPLLKWIAGGAAAVLAAGLLVVAGIGADLAMAGPTAPAVEAGITETPILGEDTSVDVRIENVTADPTYNLSVAVLMPDTVELVEPAPFGSYVTYAAGDELPGNPVAVNGETCVSAGLQPLVPGDASGTCVVPAGMQYLVFENFSDLPAQGVYSETFTVRPKVDDGTTGFKVGDPVEVSVSAYTSGEERYIPLFPGGTTKGAGDAEAATSGQGSDIAAAEMQALRITKSEPSPEHELLRGVHDQATVYTLTVDHTGEGDLGDATVTDFLPAGLEYLGSCSLTDNTSAANGNGGVEEWGGTGDSSGPLNTAAVDHCAMESSIETILTNTAFFDAHPEFNAYGLEADAVYTMVTWDIGTWEQTGSDANGTEQSFPAAAGEAAQTIIQYRAGVPLFENELFPDSTAHSPTSLTQGANLDNNTGASTRHGSATEGDDDDAADGAAHDATAYTNFAGASGVWGGVVSTDIDEYTIDAVDARVVKSVRVVAPGTDLGEGWGSQASFEQGAIADYRLSLATSEYVSAAQGSAPNGFTDELENGLCPVFPTDITSKITAGASVPELVLIDTSGASAAVGASAFNSALEAAGLYECRWLTGEFTNDAVFQGVTLSGITFDQGSGEFSQSFQLPAAELDAPNLTHDVFYSVHQNRSYLDVDSTNGSTSSGDTVGNSVNFDFTTTARDGVNNLQNSNGVAAGNEYWAWDDSNAQLSADFSSMSKWVMKNDAGNGGLTTADLIAADYPVAGPVDPASPASVWTKNEERPFAVGDQVWYRIKYEPAVGADVRNPILTDFLPEGVEFDESLLDGTNQWQDSPNYRAYVSNGGSPIDLTADPMQIGTCYYDGTTSGHTAADAYDDFVHSININDRRLTWALGSDSCFPTTDPSASQDRFWPKNLFLDIYLRVTVTDSEAFGNVDLSQNLAKYQQENVEGEVFFLRDAAEVTTATTPKLIKGIRDIGGAPSGALYPDGNPVNSNVDNEQVVQGDEVTFRVDVTAPVRGVDPETGVLASNTDSSGYVVWDALPEGIKKADIDGYVPADGTFSSADVTLTERTWPEGEPGGAPISSPETLVDAADFTAVVCDFGDPCYPAETELRADIWDAERSLIIWRLDADVPASNNETVLDKADESDPDVVIPRTERGFSLQYTVVVPDGSTDVDAALVTQRYENTASIVSYQPTTNTTDGGTSASTVFVTGDDALSTTSADPTKSDQFDTGDLGAFDDSDVFLPDLGFSKRLVSTEVGATTPAGADGTVGLTQIDTTRNNQTQIVQGEYATFEYALTVPAHTSVEGAVLSDGGSLARGSGSDIRYEFVNAEFFGPNNTTATPDNCASPGELSDFTCDETVGSGNTATHGVLTFPTTEPYQNATGDPQVFRVQVTVWVKDRDDNPTNSSVAQIGNNTGLTNTATVSYDNPASGQPGESAKLSQTGTATTTFVEPSPSLTKVVTDPANGEIDINGEATFKLTASNANNRPALYDSVVVDCVPAEMGIVAGSIVASAGTFDIPTGAPGQCSVTGDVITQGSGSGQLLVWNVGQLNGTGTTGTQTLTYKAKAKNDIGSGLQMRNVASLSGFTLPKSLVIDGTDRQTDTRRGFYTRAADETVSMVNATLEKSVATPNGLGSAPVGETVRYTLDITLPPTRTFTMSNSQTPCRPGWSTPVTTTLASAGGTKARQRYRNPRCRLPR